MTEDGDQPCCIFETQTEAEKLASGEKESGFTRAIRRIRKWCPFGRS
jgi:hypothetical protein